MSAKTTNPNQTHEADHKHEAAKPVAPQSAELTPLTDLETLQSAVATLGLARSADILTLQRTMGNRAVTRLIQAKLTVGPAGDQYEQEADQVAEQVMRMPAVPQPAQRQAEEEEDLQTKPLAASITPVIRRQAVPEEEEELQAKPLVQRDAAPEEEELQTKPLLQREVMPEEEEELQAKPLVQRDAAPEEEELQTKPLLQREVAPEEEEIQAKLLVQRHAEEEIQTKPAVQRASTGAGFEVDGEFEQQLAASRGGGSPLPAEVRSFMEPRFGADFSGVRLHTGSDAAQLNRAVQAQAFTHGQDIYLGEGKTELGSEQGKQLLAHELTHVVQQTGHLALQRTPTGTRIIQRHSSWEHALLGDADPGSLKTIADARYALEATDMTKAQKRITRENAAHAIRQEMNRVESWQDEPPTDWPTARGFEATHQVRVVGIPYAKDPAQLTFATYGEINTLADLFGNLGDLKNAMPKTVHSLLQGVRRQIYHKLESVLGEVSNSFVERTWAKMPTIGGFKGAEGSQGDVGPLPKGDMDISSAQASDPNLGKSQNYWANVGRNACHFAPQSWYAWKGYHEQARKSARNAFKVRKDAERAGIDKTQAEGVEQLSQQYANDAWLANGFGDHYLQDSYAAGHLINKTLIMQWFAEWIERGNHLDHVSDEMWGRFRQMFEKSQPGLAARHLYSKRTDFEASDPQSAENQSDREGRMGRTGLIPGASDVAQKLYMWWSQKYQADDNFTNLYPEKVAHEVDGTDLPGTLKNVDAAENALAQLTNVRLVEDKGTVDENLALKGKVGRFFGRVGNLFGGQQRQVHLFVLETGKVSKVPQNTQAELRGALMENSYKNYHSFVNSAYLQAATKVLHDHYCQHGLMVGTKADGPLMQVYGDDNMLKAGAGAGVQYSAQTARLSQESIAKTIAGQEDQAPTIEAIFDRFPSYVSDKDSTGGETVSLADWHSEGYLHAFAQRAMFPQVANSVKFFFLGTVKGEIGEISQDKHDEGPF
jgi:hypothetical protein